jgi:hypothetical protein
MFEVDLDRGWDKVVKHLTNWNSGVIFWGVFDERCEVFERLEKIRCGVVSIIMLSPQSSVPHIVFCENSVFREVKLRVSQKKKFG